MQNNSMKTEYDQLMEKMEKLGYHQMTYDEACKVEMNGRMFSLFVGHVASNRESIQTLMAQQQSVANSIMSTVVNTLTALKADTSLTEDQKENLNKLQGALTAITSESFKSLTGITEHMAGANDAIYLKMMEAHIDNCENGNAISEKEFDKREAIRNVETPE